MGILKLGGIASGLDTEGIIRQLLAVDRKPIALLEQRTEKLSTEASAWRDLNSRLLNLQNRLTDLKDLSSSTWSAKRISVSAETVLKATTTSTALPGSYSVQVTALADATTWQSNLAVADASADLGQAGTIQVAGGPGNGKTFDVVATDSLNDLATKINADSTNLGFTASVLQVNPGDYRLVVRGNTGTANDFSLADSVGTAGGSLKITAGTGAQVTTAANSQAVVNGVTINADSNTVKDAIPGVTMTLFQFGMATVTVSKDNQKAIDAVKAFVDQYNSYVEFAKQATSYDAKDKKAGTLFGETMVRSLGSALSGRLLDPVSGLAAGKDALSSIGITTEKFSAGGKASGKLTFDQAKFTAALEADPDAISNLFGVDDGTSKGVGVRAVELLDSFTKTGGMVLGQAKMLDTQVTQVKDRIKYYDETIAPMKEKRLRDQFVALDKAMSLLQNQGSWLSAQLDSLRPVKS